MARRDPFKNLPGQQNKLPENMPDPQTPNAPEGMPAPVDPIQELVQSTAAFRTPVRKTRKRAWDQQNADQLFSVRGVPAEIHTAVQGLADELNVPHGDVARAFLEFGLTCYRRGEIPLEAKPQGKRMTLYTRDGWGQELPGWREITGWTGQPSPKPVPSERKKKGKEGKTSTPVTSYRSIPLELQAGVRELAAELGVPVGQVATALLAHSLQAYQSGRLDLTPQPPAPQPRLQAKE